LFTQPPVNIVKIRANFQGPTVGQFQHKAVWQNQSDACVTTESGGEFEVSLTLEGWNTDEFANDAETFEMVTVTGRVRDVGEALFKVPHPDLNFTLESTASAVWDADNFNTSHIITLQGIDDKEFDKNVFYTMEITAKIQAMDGEIYTIVAENLIPNIMFCTNTDNDSPDIQIELPPTGERFTTESEGEFPFEVQLTTEPSAPVTVTVTTDDPNEGIVEIPLRMQAMSKLSGRRLTGTSVGAMYV
jgi:hypothetical protein